MLPPPVEWTSLIHPPREDPADLLTAAEEHPVLANGFATGE
jgi:hypothetical protein